MRTEERRTIRAQAAWQAAERARVLRGAGPMRAPSPSRAREAYETCAKATGSELINRRFSVRLTGRLSDPNGFFNRARSLHASLRRSLPPGVILVGPMELGISPPGEPAAVFFLDGTAGARPVIIKALEGARNRIPRVEWHEGVLEHPSGICD